MTTDLDAAQNEFFRAAAGARDEAIWRECFARGMQHLAAGLRTSAPPAPPPASTTDSPHQAMTSAPSDEELEELFLREMGKAKVGADKRVDLGKHAIIARRALFDAGKAAGAAEREERVLLLEMQRGELDSALAIVIPELAKQYQKAQVYGSAAQKYRDAAIERGLPPDARLDAEPCTDAKARAFVFATLGDRVDALPPDLRRDGEGR